jgi:hypothetical protein
MRILRFLLGFTQPVDRRAYALWGFGLMALKYAVEAAAAWVLTHRVYTPLDFLDPRLEARSAFFRTSDPYVDAALLALSMACLWIALSMSIRRAVDAGHRASLGLLVLVPVVNLAVMLYLAARPSDRSSRWIPPRAESAHAPLLRPALLGVAVGMGVLLALFPLLIWVRKDYSLLLFLVLPLLSSTAAAYAFNRPFGFSLGASIAVAELNVAIGSLALLLFALEGVLCIAMALPLIAVTALLGGVLGHGLAAQAAMRRGDWTAVLLLLPVLMGAERWEPPPPLREVVTTIEIDAPPEVVWEHVVSFGAIDAPPPWYFAAGIAYPVRAEIHGRGVGAVRHCVFSTGAFVEPITVWDPPRRLAFDVSEQPPPMRELSPWGDIAAPHLSGTLTSRRGEFRLVALEGGRTRLEGSTWYTLDMGPQAYWTLWSDALIGRIHGRVLEHVRGLAE